MYCKHCGFKVPEGAEFCDNCGHRMNASNWIDKLESLREDELTHAGEQPRKTDLFPDRPSKKSSGKRAPPATPECRAIHPAYRPMTSRIMIR